MSLKNLLSTFLSGWMLLTMAAHTGYAEESIVGGKLVLPTDPIAQTTVALVALTLLGEAICTASIVDKDILITAAHCVTDPFSGGTLSGDDLRIVFNRSVQAGARGAIKALGAITHPTWERTGSATSDLGDIAIVRFAGGLPAGFRPAVLLPSTAALVNKQIVTLSGYGVTTMVGGGSGDGVLRTVQVPIAAAKFAKTEVLLDQRQGKGACHGDSGGPATVSIAGKTYLWGVTNRGYPDTGPDDCKQYSVYTNIIAHKSFVQSAINSLRQIR